LTTLRAEDGLGTRVLLLETGTIIILNGIQVEAVTDLIAIIHAPASALLPVDVLPNILQIQVLHHVVRVMTDPIVMTVNALELIVLVAVIGHHPDVVRLAILRFRVITPHPLD
jgi:hypothetical protein